MIVQRKFIIGLLVLLSMCFSVGIRVDLVNDYLNSGLNPKTIAEGSTGIMSAEGSEAVFYNPALLVRQTSPHLLLSYNPYSFDRSMLYAFYRFPFRYRQATFGVGCVYDSIDGVEYRSGNTVTADSIGSVWQSAIVLAMARELEANLTFGVNIQFLMDNYTKDPVNNINFSGGLAYLNPDVPYAGAVVFSYRGTDMYVLSVGSKYVFENIAELDAVYDYYLGNGYANGAMKLGGSYFLTSDISLHAGKNGDTLSGGVSYRLKDMTLHYAMTVSPLSTNHQFGFELL